MAFSVRWGPPAAGVPPAGLCQVQVRGHLRQFYRGRLGRKHSPARDHRRGHRVSGPDVRRQKQRAPSRRGKKPRRVLRYQNDVPFVGGLHHAGAGSPMMPADIAQGSALKRWVAGWQLFQRDELHERVGPQAGHGRGGSGRYSQTQPGASNCKHAGAQGTIRYTAPAQMIRTRKFQPASARSVAQFTRREGHWGSRV